MNNKVNARQGVILTASSVPITAAVASINIELINENTGETTKLAITLNKTRTDGYFIINVQDFSSFLKINNTYMYVVSSGSTTVDIVDGKFDFVEATTNDDAIKKTTETERRLDQRLAEIIKQIEDKE